MPFGMPAHGTAALEKAFLKEASLEFVRLDRRGVVEIGSQRLARRKPAAATPRPAHELRRVDVVASQRAAENDIEPDQNLSERSAPWIAATRRSRVSCGRFMSGIGESVET